MSKRWDFYDHSDGSRVRVPAGKIGPASLQRNVYRMHVTNIVDTHDLRATLRAGKYTSMGSYPVYLGTFDGGCLCMDCSRKEYRQLSEAIRHNLRGDWHVAYCAVNYESTDLYCDHCNTAIESAYGEG